MRATRSFGISLLLPLSACSQGYTRDELLVYRLTVLKNVVDSAQAIVLALRKFELEPANIENREICDKILQYRIDADPNAT